MLMAPRNELNAGGPWFCHLAFPICLDLENKTSPWTFLGSSTPSPSQLQRGGKDRVRGRFGGGGQRDSVGKGAPQKYVSSRVCSSGPCMGRGPLQKKFGGIAVALPPSPSRGAQPTGGSPRRKVVSRQKGPLQQSSPRESGWGGKTPPSNDSSSHGRAKGTCLFPTHSPRVDEGSQTFCPSLAD